MATTGSTSRVFDELRGFAPALLAAGIAQAGVFWWAGWRGPVLLVTPGLWVAMVASGVVVARRFSQYLLVHPTIRARLTRTAAIIGHDEHARRVAECFASRGQYGMHIQGIFADPPGAQDQLPLSGSISDLIGVSKKSRLDAIIIALPPGRGHENDIAGLVWRLRSVAADVFVAPYLMQGPNILLPMQAIGPMSFTVLQRRPLNELQGLCKRIFDYIVCLLILLPLSILFLCIAIAIKLDSPGPVLFRQPRLGLNNQPFTILKFRSMYADKTDLMAVQQTSRGDPRVTRVGKWLRRLSIDEMPQIFNVLRGDMSLVGPRPHAPQTRIEGELLDDVLVEYVMRYRVKPGITGWAQVNGARGQLMNSEDLRRRVRFDLEYIQRWSLGFDLKIMILTLLREIFSKDAF
jgi:Undecaprenyl-phosphate glucose phosphotransferase